MSAAIRLAPDWLPNTNHIGFYIARALGCYAAEGIALDILPFDGEAMPNRKIAAGDAEFGLMPHQSLATMRARGVDVLSVAALVQPNTTSLMVRADTGIARPADLAGRRYASYGTEYEVALVNEMIRLDGGAGGVELVPAEKLDILQALYDGALDVAWGFYAWEGVQAELAGVPLRHFFVAEQGLPPEYFPLLFTARAVAESRRDTVAAFVRATARGYTYAATHPEEAAALFLRDVDPHVLPPHAGELVPRSLRWLAPRLIADAPRWGWHDPARWSAFAALLARLAPAIGAPVAPDAQSAAFTNEFLPRVTSGC
jgi:ABC-type nitrate/sulfonate/bicarbonate transport system substrate-binding protein